MLTRTQEAESTYWNISTFSKPFLQTFLELPTKCLDPYILQLWCHLRCSSKSPVLSLFTDWKVLLAFGTCHQGCSGSNFPVMLSRTLQIWAGKVQTPSGNTFHLSTGQDGQPNKSINQYLKERPQLCFCLSELIHRKMLNHHWWCGEKQFFFDNFETQVQVKSFGLVCGVGTGKSAKSEKF